MKPLLFLAFSSCLFAQSWKTSAVGLTAATGVDIYSSQGLYETNPILGVGNFGRRQALVSSGITLGVLLGEWAFLKRHPRYVRVLAWANLSLSGVHLAAGVHNFRQ